MVYRHESRTRTITAGGYLDGPASSAKFWFSATSVFVGFAPNLSTPQKHADATKTKPTADVVTPRAQASNLSEEVNSESESGRVSGAGVHCTKACNKEWQAASDEWLCLRWTRKPRFRTVWKIVDTRAACVPYPEKRQQKHMNPSETAIVGNSLPATRPDVEMARNNVARTQRTRVNHGAAA